MAVNYLLRWPLVAWGLVGCITSSWAQPVASSTAAAVVIPNQTSPLRVKSASIEAADRDWETINSLKRQQAIKEAKLQLDNVGRDRDKAKGQMGQTSAGNIVIGPDGYRAATLLFIDGSNLNVELGSQLSGYRVSEISLGGVTLQRANCRRSKCAGQWFIRRSYPQQPTSRTSLMASQSNLQPTPVAGYSLSANEERPPFEQVPGISR